MDKFRNARQRDPRLAALRKEKADAKQPPRQATEGEPSKKKAKPLTLAKCPVPHQENESTLEAHTEVRIVMIILLTKLLLDNFHGNSMGGFWKQTLEF